MLMRNARLAELRTAFDEASHTLTIRSENREAARGDLRTPEGRAAIEAVLRRVLRRRVARTAEGAARGGPQLLRRGRKVISIINLASVAALEDAAGAPVHPLRFRGNLHVEGWPAWHEFDLLDAEIAIGPSARLKVVKRIVRCAATEVDPDTGIRDLPIPRTLMEHFRPRRLRRLRGGDRGRRRSRSATP